jgi:hypothetical protein
VEPAVREKIIENNINLNNGEFYSMRGRLWRAFLFMYRETDIEVPPTFSSLDLEIYYLYAHGQFEIGLHS